MKNNALITLATALVLTWAPPAFACLHAMSKASAKPTPVKAADLQAIVGWHDGVEHLVVAMGYESDPETSAKLAYVLPVPNPPADYSVAEADVFEQMREYVDLERIKPRMRTKSARARSAPPGSTAVALEALDTEAVGPYEIHPLKARGTAGLEALQSWMKENDFEPISEEKAKYYVDRQWTFLAIEVDPKKQKSKSGTIPPLQVRFPTERAVMPLKLLDFPQSIKATVYLVTGKRIDDTVAANVADRYGFEVVRGRRYNRAPGLRKGSLRAARDRISDDAPNAVGELANSFGWDLESEPHLAVLHSARLGWVLTKPSTWREDLSIPPPDGKLMGGMLEAQKDDPVAADPPTGSGAEGRPATSERDEATAPGGSSAREGDKAPGAMATKPDDPEAKETATGCGVARADRVHRGTMCLLLGLFFLGRRRSAR